MDIPINQVPPNPAAATSGRIGIDVGILVANLERSLGFYRDLLGLPVVATVSTALIGHGQMVQLAHGSALVKLVELETPPPAQPGTSLNAALGYRYITLLIHDVEAMVEVLVRADVPMVLPVTGLATGAAIAMVADPDGNIVELVQEPPSHPAVA